MGLLEDLWDAPATKQEEFKPILTPILERVIEQANKKIVPPAKEPAFRASGLGKCKRNTLYKLRGYVDNKTAKEIMTLDLGTAMHEVLQKYVKQANILISMEDEISVPEIRKTNGHYDGLIEINGKRYLLEIKTSNVEAYQRMVLRPVPYPAHQKQTTFYMKALGVTETILLMVNKNGMFTAEFEKTWKEANFNPVFLEMLFKYDEKILQENKDEVDDLIEHYENGTMPEFKQVSMCTYCPAEIKDRCKIDRKIERKAAKAKAAENQ